MVRDIRLSLCERHAGILKLGVATGSKITKLAKDQVTQWFKLSTNLDFDIGALYQALLEDIHL